MVPVFAQCKSHPGRPLVAHLADVGQRVSDPLLRVVALCHDTGKATTYFQEYLSNRPPADRRLKQHSHLGAEVLLAVLWAGFQQGVEVRADRILLACGFVRRHHGALDNLVEALSATDEQKRVLESQKRALDLPGLVRWLVGLGHGYRECLDLDRTGLRVKAQRVLRIDAEPGSYMARFQRALRDFGLLIESDRDSAGGFPEGHFSKAPQYAVRHVDAFTATLRGGSPDMARVRSRLFAGARAAAVARPPNAGALWALTCPTGSGKTLAALGWAFRRRESRVSAGRPNGPVIYALPFTSIIDQNAAVLQQVYGQSPIDESVLSVHHHLSEPGLLLAQGEESLARNWTEGWRADCVCTTFVQVVNALYHATAWDARRMSHLVNGILILDEVQGIPARLWPIIRESLRCLSREFGVDVLLMTATQPAILGEAEAVEIAPPDVANEPVFNRYDVRAEVGESIDLAGVAETARLEMSSGARSCLIVLNTIQEALDLFALIQRSPWAAAFRHYHLSTNLRPKDRRRVLREVEAEPTGAIVVATQVVEAGLDLSFDVVLRALAPLDSIVQAAGRCNRHGTGLRGRVRIVNVQGNSGAKVYGPTHMDVAAAMCREVARGAAPEPELLRLVSRYFRELKQRVSQDEAKAILKAVQMMEFASLRGEGIDVKERRVVLIEDQFDRVAHFVETDDSDRVVWERWRQAFKLEDRGERSRAIRGLRGQVGQRIVEVPRMYALQTEPDKTTGLIYVSELDARREYSMASGWSRTR